MDDPRQQTQSQSTSGVVAGGPFLLNRVVVLLCIVAVCLVFGGLLRTFSYDAAWAAESSGIIRGIQGVALIASGGTSAMLAVVVTLVHASRK